MAQYKPSALWGPVCITIAVFQTKKYVPEAIDYPESYSINIEHYSGETTVTDDC